MKETHEYSHVNVGVLSACHQACHLHEC